MERITLPQIEEAINYWRKRVPSQGEESRLCPQAAALAAPYALMIIGHRPDIGAEELPLAALAAYQSWRDATD
ncbi:DUF3717 domain-containing protein [Bordetella sp. FB-8]|uniref:DUF3717 domain-containing protein n=1 Tax=Bordetella sp. FB-8 TaxID=1159870 RepID=UPI00036F79D9|nr:DUF3717 domain-containing protein [Bordetella sp. FB-8]